MQDLKKLRGAQRELAKRVVLKDVFQKRIVRVAGIDMAFLNELAVVACVIVDHNSLELKSKKISLTRLSFPYIPTFLGFREGPPIIDMIHSVEPKPDLFFINAQGIAHPTFCGCASKVGVLANVPTIGVAARNLCGEYVHEPQDVGDSVPVYYGGRPVGWVLKSREGCRPIFISPGHMVSLNSSLEITMSCLKNHKLPEPLYFAHTAAREEKRQISQRV